MAGAIACPKGYERALGKGLYLKGLVGDQLTVLYRKDHAGVSIWAQNPHSEQPQESETIPETVGQLLSL